MQPIVCLLIGHDWSMYAGKQVRVHPSAVCRRCGKKYENSSSGGHSH